MATDDVWDGADGEWLGVGDVPAVVPGAAVVSILNW